MVSYDAGFRIGTGEGGADITVTSVVADTPGTEPEEKEYTEKTFSDFDMENGQHTRGYFTKADMKSWVDVAFTGDILFKASGAHTGFSIDKADGNGWETFQIYRNNSTIEVRHFQSSSFRLEEDNTKEMNFTSEELGGVDLSSTTLRVRFCFDKVDETTLKTTVSITAGNNSVTKVGIMSGVAAMVSYDAGFRIGTGEDGADITVTSVAYETPGEEPEEKEYTEKTFSDFGMENGQHTRGYFTKADMKSWVDVAFTGDILFKASGAHTGFSIDKADGNGWETFQIYRNNSTIEVRHFQSSSFRLEEDNTKEMNFTSEELGGVDLSSTTLRVRFYFDQVDESTLKITVNITAGETSVTKVGIITGVAAMIFYDAGFRIGTGEGGADITVTSVVAETPGTEPEDPDDSGNTGDTEEITYTNIKFSNFGIKSQEISDGVVVGTLEEYDTLDKMAFTGYVTFPEGRDNGYFTIGAKGDSNGVSVFCSGNTIWFWDETGMGTGCLDAFGADELGYDVSGVELKVQVSFLYDEEKVTVAVSINDSEVKTKTIDGYGNWLGTKLLALAGADGALTIKSSPDDVIEKEEETIVSNTPQKALSEYTDLTFIDFGISDQTVVGFGRECNGAIQSLDGKVFKGRVTFPADGTGYIRIGGTAENKWFGIHVESVDNGLRLSEAANGKQKWFIDMDTIGKNVENTEIELAITFTQVDEHNVYVGVYVDGTFCGEKLYKNLEQPFGSTLLAYSETTGIKLVSVGAGMGVTSTPQNPLSDYEMVTFIDFGIKDETVVGFGRECNGKMKTLDGKAFKGLITFPSDGAGYIRIGGMTDNKWYGIHVESVAGGLRLSEAANGKQTWVIRADTIGKNIENQQVELIMTFTQVDDHNVYVGVYVDGKFCGEKLYENLEQPFGATLLAYSETAGIAIASVETAWQKFLKSKVNLAYFGFTDNWKQELADICR